MIGGLQDRILEHRYSGSFLLNHPLGFYQARKLLRVVEVPGHEEMSKTVKRLQPDCLLRTFTPGGPAVLESAGARVPVLSLALLPDNKAFSGVDQQMEQVASNAVDLVAEQLIHGRRGIPRSCKTILTSGRWVNRLK